MNRITNRRLFAMVLVFVPAVASASDSLWPPGPTVDVAGFSIRSSALYESGVVPEFRQAERSRTVGTVDLDWNPEGPVRLNLNWGYLRERYSSGRTRTGPGDIRIGAEALVLERGADLVLGWQVKLPNASDELELGTDETDSILWVRGRSTMGMVEVGLVAGLAIIGNPLQFANQDDVPLSWFDVTVPVGEVRLDGRIGGGWATARNPARMEANLGFETGCPWLIGGRGGVGLTPAAPDWGGQLWIGWRQGCPG